MPDQQSKEEIDEILKRHLEREQAAIRFGFPVGIAVIVMLAIWFIVWRGNAGPAGEALVEITARRIDLPASPFTYPLDGAPLLQEQWGLGNVPAPPFPVMGAMDFLVVEASGASALIQSETTIHQDLVLAADSQTALSKLLQGLDTVLDKHPYERLWIGTRTTEFVGLPGQKIKLEPYELSNLGIVPIPLRYHPGVPPQSASGISAVAVAPSEHVASLAASIDAVYRKGKAGSLLLRVREKKSTSSPPPSPEK
ncbi:MAG: hypothetical protein GXP25_08780 [Planctomycetes bacterium]|nr:hypothetical protein [Planctomycetota bacterium]